MKLSGNSRRPLIAITASLLLATAVQTTTARATANPAPEEANQEQDHLDKHLQAGEVVVDSQVINGTRYIIGKILIEETPEKLWPVLVNPFEFQGRICHRMKKFSVLTDQPNLSVIDCRLGIVFPIPDIDYVVESHYTPGKRIDFRRVSGSLRDFKGFWEIKQFDANRTQVTYSMYLDPGFPVPEWIVRQGVRSELPSVLTGLRTRMHSLKHCNGIPEKHNIAASVMPFHTL
jgi:hypothetical protein